MAVEMVPKYNRGETRAWQRGHRKGRLGKPRKCQSDNNLYIWAWLDGYDAALAEKKIIVEETKPWTGKMTNAKYYDHALSNSEIAQKFMEE